MTIAGASDLGMSAGFPNSRLVARHDIIPRACVAHAHCLGLLWISFFKEDNCSEYLGFPWAAAACVEERHKQE